MKVIDCRHLFDKKSQAGERRKCPLKGRCPKLDRLELELLTRGVERESESLLRRSELLLKEAESTLKRMKALERSD